MKAIYFDGVPSIADLPQPVPRQKEALIRVLKSGICNTDLEIVKGYMDFKGVLGHEWVGVVEQCQERSFINKRVVGEINIGCGTCWYCKNSLQRHCPRRRVMGISGKDGAFAQLLTLPLDNLHLIPDSIADEEAVFAEPLAAALQILEQTSIRPTDRVAVLGDGKLGLLVAQVLKLTGCELVLLGHHQEKLRIAAQMGIPVATQRAIEGKNYDLIIECSGSPDGTKHALQLVRPGGKIVIKSTFREKVDLDISCMVVDEVQLIGSRCGPFAPAIRLLSQRLVQVRPLITKTFPLTRGVEALEFADTRKENLKVLIENQK
ncbi:alcohol dehydrogenase [bacterium (candidate division B38) B3_B38]|nr:MAG: alcohol dehydrogenase [bacterium (candidate division B38) B3_B38]